MLSELESLCAKHNLTPDRLIIESPDWQTLELLLLHLLLRSLRQTFTIKRQ